MVKIGLNTITEHIAIKMVGEEAIDKAVLKFNGFRHIDYFKTRSKHFPGVVMYAEDFRTNKSGLIYLDNERTLETFQDRTVMETALNITMTCRPINKARKLLQLIIDDIV